jgi:hypothetical protein
MFQRLIRGIGILALALLLTAPIQAQPPTQPAADPGASLSPPSQEKPAHPTSAPGLVLTFLSTLLILFIICKPPRKV